MIFIVKIVAIGIIGVFLTITVRQQKPELAMGISLATVGIILGASLKEISTVIELLSNICERAGIDYIYFAIILKIIGISYITQLASSTANDSGQTAIAAKIDIAGKICIVVLSVPIIKGIFDVILGLIN